MFVVGADIGGIAHDEVELFLLADRLPPGAAAKRHLGLEFLRVAFGRKQRLLRDVGRHDFGILHFQGERDGEASAPRAEIEHARRLAKEFERRVDEHFRVGPGNQNGGIHLEETPVKILLSRNVGDGRSAFAHDDVEAELLDLLLVGDVQIMGDQKFAAHAERMRKQHHGFEPADLFGSLLDQRADVGAGHEKVSLQREDANRDA